MYMYMLLPLLILLGLILHQPDFSGETHKETICNHLHIAIGS